MNKLIDMLKRHEGEVKVRGRHVAYKCPADHITIGIGRNIDPEGGMGLSDEEAEYLLRNDIRRVSEELEKAFPWFKDLDTVRIHAMIDITFNLGLPRLKKFKKALTAMSIGDWKTAEIEFLDSKWARQVGYRAIELAEMIRTGKYSDAI